jgi:hypothetical protein
MSFIFSEKSLTLKELESGQGDCVGPLSSFQDLSHHGEEVNKFHSELERFHLQQQLTTLEPDEGSIELIQARVDAISIELQWLQNTVLMTSERIELNGQRIRNLTQKIQEDEDEEDASGFEGDTKHARILTAIEAEIVDGGIDVRRTNGPYAKYVKKLEDEIKLKQEEQGWAAHRLMLNQARILSIQRKLSWAAAKRRREEQVYLYQEFLKSNNSNID